MLCRPAPGIAWASRDVLRATGGCRCHQQVSPHKPGDHSCAFAIKHFCSALTFNFLFLHISSLCCLECDYPGVLCKISKVIFHNAMHNVPVNAFIVVYSYIAKAHSFLETACQFIT